MGTFEEIEFVIDGSVAPTEFFLGEVNEFIGGEFIVMEFDDFEEFFWGKAWAQAFIGAFDFGGIQIGSDHDGGLPADDERIDRGMVTDDEVEGKGEIFLVFGESDDVIGVTNDCSGATDAVFGFFGGLVAFGKMDTESAGDLVLVNRIEGAKDGAHMGLVIFVFEMVKEFVKGIDKNDVDTEFSAALEELGTELLPGKSGAAQVPDKQASFVK